MDRGLGVHDDAVVLDGAGRLTGQEVEITLDTYRAMAGAVWEYLGGHGGNRAPTVPDLRVRA